MYYIEYQQCNSSGGGPVLLCTFKNQLGVEGKLNELEEEKVKTGMDYKILVLIEGKRLYPKQTIQWDFTEKENKTENTIISS